MLRVLLLSCLAFGLDKPEPPLPLEPKTVSTLMKAKTVVVYDVREQEERQEVIPGALWMPMSAVDDAKLWERFKRGIPKGKTVVFHCRSGRRSKLAAEKLSSEGYKAAYFDGPDQWKAAGLELKKGPAK